MATIYLIRHGQAQFGMEEYDALSPTGIEQAKLLGKNLVQRKIQPTKIISGAMQRHQQTTSHCLESMQLSSNMVQTDANWNEFDHRDVIAKYDTRYADLNQLKQAIFLDSNPKQKILEIIKGAVIRWTSGHHHDYNESWTAFCERIQLGLQTVVENTDENDVVFVFTSGGSISVVMQQLLNLSIQKTFELQLNIANASITKLKTGTLGLRLLSFSDFAHFEGEHANFLTYR